MKKYSLVTISMVILCAIMLLFCKKNDPTPSGSGNSTITGNNTLTATGTLAFHLHNYLKESEIDESNVVYTVSDGRKLLISDSKIFISNIVLVKTNDSLLPLTGVIIVKSMDNIIIPLGKVPVGTYKSLSFHVGLDSLSNTSVPGPGGVLSDNSLWFGSTAQPQGYTFVHFAGKIDTTTSGNGVAADMQSFNYRIGTMSHYKKVVMPDKNFTITEDQTNYFHIICDFYKIFNGIELNKITNLKVENVADNNSEIANKIADNIPGMFSYEEE